MRDVPSERSKPRSGGNTLDKRPTRKNNVAVPSDAASSCFRIGAVWSLLSVGACESDCIDGESLWSTAAMPAAISVCGDLVVTGRSQENLQVLASVKEIGGGLYVYDNPLITEIPALSGLSHLGGPLSISGNEALISVRGFPALVQLEGGVYVGENPRLADFQLGEGVETVESVFFALNPELTEVRGDFTEVDGSFTVVENAALVRIEMPALTTLARHLHIGGNPSLNFIDFPVLDTLKGTLRIEDNDALQKMPGFAALAEAAGVRITDNDVLREVRLFSPLSVSGLFFVGGNVGLLRISVGEKATFAQESSILIHDHPVLETIDGFGAVNSVTSLRIWRNDNLREVSAFAALASIAGPLEIIDNPTLTGPAEWFPSLRTVEDLSIHQNPGLAPAVVDALLGHVTVMGATRVGDNQGEDTALDPCPWANDGICDGVSSRYTTALCAKDPGDCGE